MALAVDPRDAGVVYLGAAVGGVWKTVDGGLNWRPLTDFQPSLAIASLALDPSNPDVIYAGTGEQVVGYYGAGLLKSADGGATWTHLPGPFAGPLGPDTFFGGGARIPSVAVHPVDGRVLLAAVRMVSPANRSGVYRSTDSGVTWTNVLPLGEPHDVIFDRSRPNIVYASLGTLTGSPDNGIYKSTDAGLTWRRTNGSGANVIATEGSGIIELEISPSAPAVLFAGVHNRADGSLVGMFKSTDAGENWVRLNAPDYCRPQCRRANVIRVHPLNPDVVFAGGAYIDSRGANSRLFRSLNGGSTWTEISIGANGEELHADTTALAFSRDGTRLYAANDGGAWSTTGVTSASVSWTNLNTTLGITQFYPGFSIHPSDVNVTFGGTQDNGIQRYDGTLSWQQVECGDGGWTAIDFTRPATVYATCQNIRILKSTTGGAAFQWTIAENGIDTRDRVQFIPPMVMDPSNAQRLYFGTFRVYQTANGAASWSAISPDLAGGDATVTALAVAARDSNTVYAGISTGGVHVTRNAGSGVAATWINASAGLPPRSVTQIIADPASPAAAYVTFSGFSGFAGDTQGHLFRTRDAGATWTDASGNLPNKPVNDLVIDPDVANALYAATDIGVFATGDGGITWAPLATGLPRSVVLGLKLHQPTRTLRAATYGRGMWDLQLPVAGRVLPTLNAGGTVNAASFSPTLGVAPGSIAAVFGTDLAPATASAASLPLPVSLAGTSLAFNARFAAPLFFVSPRQMNVQVPWEVTAGAEASLAVQTGGITFNAAMVSVVPFAPAIFTINQQGTGQGAILIANSGEVAAPAGSIPGRATRPARRGEYVSIYCTGLGDVTNRPPTGAPAPAMPLSETAAIPFVAIGGVPAAVSFSGLAPGFAGLYQVNVQVPASAAAGDAVAVTVMMGGIGSNTVTLAIQE